MVYGFGESRILVYTDDGLRTPGNRHVDRALQSLGLPYTVFNDDPNGFAAALASQSWDLVIVDHNGYYAIGNLWEELRAYLEAGGSLLITTFDVDGSHGESTLLWQDIGASAAGDQVSVPLPVQWWQRGHPLFNTPETVPDFSLMQNYYLDSGDFLVASPATGAVAGFVSSPTAGQAAIIVSHAYSAVLNSFLIAQNISDLDADGKPDGQELYANEIDFLLRGSGWLTVDPLQGEIPPGETAVVAVTADASSLASGLYGAEIRFSSNDPAAPLTVIPVSLELRPAQDMDVSDVALAFGGVYVDVRAEKILTVSNRGELPLRIDPPLIDGPAFTTDASGFTLDPGEHRDLVVAFDPDRAGPFSAALSLSSDDPDEGSMTVVLTGEGVSAPKVNASPTSFHEVLLAGQSVTRTFTISNEGGTPLQFEVSAENVEDAAALSLDPAGMGGAATIVATGRPVPVDDLAPRLIAGPRTLEVHGVRPIDDTGEGSPAPSGSGMRLIGSNEEVFGNQDNLLSGDFRGRGNIFHCTSENRLVEHRFWLSPSGPAQMWFLVYEGPSASGTYTLVSASDASPAGPGEGWYSSGRVDVPLHEGRYYLIFASFDVWSTYYNQQNISPYPIPASFGELIAGIGWNWVPEIGFPPLPTQFVDSGAYGEPVAYYQTLVTGPGAAEWVSFVPDAGSVPPSPRWTSTSPSTRRTCSRGRSTPASRSPATTPTSRSRRFPCSSP